MVFKGRHSRKSLLTRGRASATSTARPDFSPLHQTHARYEKKKRRGTPRNAKAWKKLDRPPALRACPPFCGSSRRFRRSAGFLLVSAVTRSPQPFFPFQAAIFLSSHDRSFTPRSHGSTARVRGGVTSVENRRAMKQTSRPTLCRY